MPSPDQRQLKLLAPLYHFVLPYSNWETGTICFSETYESLISVRACRTLFGNSAVCRERMLASDFRRRLQSSPPQRPPEDLEIIHAFCWPGYKKRFGKPLTHPSIISGHFVLPPQKVMAWGSSGELRAPRASLNFGSSGRNPLQARLRD